MGNIVFPWIRKAPFRTPPFNRTFGWPQSARPSLGPTTPATAIASVLIFQRISGTNGRICQIKYAPKSVLKV